MQRRLARAVRPPLASAASMVLLLAGCGGADEPPQAPTAEPAVSSELAPISAIQGSCDISPRLDDRVRVEAVVVGDFQAGGLGEHGDLGGFFLQEEAADQDGDPLSSEGIFIHEGDEPLLDVRPGDLVSVKGAVAERSGLTAITLESVKVLSRGVELPEPVEITLPLPEASSLEAIEGMRVQLPQSLVISDFYNFDRYGEVVLGLPRSGEARLFQPTTRHPPGSVAQQARAADNRLQQILLDDGRNSQNPSPARHPDGHMFNLAHRFRGGDRISGLSGVLSFAAGRYRIQPTAEAVYEPKNPRPDVPEVGGELRVATFNVLNYFTTLGERGARDAGEFERQREKIFAALAALNADVVGLIEIENNDGRALNDLVAGLNDHLGNQVYEAVQTGRIGDDAIAVALIYRPATVGLKGNFAVLDSSVDSRFVDTKNRPSLAQTFVDRAGNDLTVVVNHFKSKGSDCDDLGDVNRGDGAGNCNATREQSAQALAAWALADPTNNGDSDVVLIGDFNSYREESPVAVLEAAGFSDLLEQFEGGASYTYVYGGQVGALDYAFARSSMLDQNVITGAAAWHINADEPDLLDYTTRYKRDTQDAIYAADPFRSSDHDPVLIGVSLSHAQSSR